MNDHSIYETLRQLADSWGLLGMLILFLVLTLWPFRPGAKDRNTRAATAIFEDQSDGE